MSEDEQDEKEFEQITPIVRELAKTDPAAKSLFDVMATRERDPSSTSIARLAKIIRSDKTGAINLARKLQEAGLGEYKVGRRGGVSRFVWSWSAISLAEVVAGTSEEVLRVDENAEIEQEPGEGSSGGQQSDNDHSAAPLMLTIPQAKEALARTLDIPIDKIKIFIEN